MDVTSRTKIIVGLTFAAYSLITILLGIRFTRLTIIVLSQGFIMTVTTIAFMVVFFSYMRNDSGTIEQSLRNLALTDPSSSALLHTFP